jgi:hypothetical protein
MERKLEAFLLANFLHKDPMLRLLESTEDPFTWREWKSSKQITAEEKAVFEPCRKPRMD